MPHYPEGCTNVLQENERRFWFYNVTKFKIIMQEKQQSTWNTRQFLKRIIYSMADECQKKNSNKNRLKSVLFIEYNMFREFSFNNNLVWIMH